MIIKSMTATFGKLEKAKLTCAEGLNLIHAPNEGGKSTWAAFYQAMLYGIHGMSLEIGDTFYAFSTEKLSDYVITHGAETYANFIRTILRAYDRKDRGEYAAGLPWKEATAE